MAQHGYLREGYGMHGDVGAEREDRERGWRERDEDWREEDRGRGRGLMFGSDRDRFRERDEDRGFFERMGDEARSWFGDEDEEDRGRGRSWRSRERGMSHYGPEHGYGGFQGDFSGGREQGGFGGRGDYERGRKSFSANPDDHYLSWRQRQLEALDRDYEDYCREREQQFHQEFDSWRSSRQGRQGQQSQPGPQATGQSDELLLNRTTTQSGAAQEPQSTVDADSGATAGQAEPPTTGRGRR